MNIEWNEELVKQYVETYPFTIILQILQIHGVEVFKDLTVQAVSHAKRTDTLTK